jgi:hypothetical protein
MQGEEDEVGRGQPVRMGIGEGQAGQPAQVRVHGGDRCPGVGSRGDRTEFKVGMRGDQAEQFTAGVATGPGDRHADPHASSSGCLTRQRTP